MGIYTDEFRKDTRLKTAGKLFKIIWFILKGRMKPKGKGKIQAILFEFYLILDVLFCGAEMRFDDKTSRKYFGD